MGPPPPPSSLALKANGDPQNLAVRQQSASRDSQISLPEEARRYYATMASPAVSPGMKFNFSSSPGTPVKAEHVVDGPSSQQQQYPHAHSDANGVAMAGINGAAANGVGLGIPTEPAGAGLSPDVRGRGANGGTPDSRRAGSVTTEEGGEFLDMDDEDSAYETGVNGDAGSSQYVAYDDAPRESAEVIAARKREKAKLARPTVEDFPLPPGSPQYASPSVHIMGTPSRQNSQDVQSRPSLSSAADSQTFLNPSAASTLSNEPPASPFPLPIPANPPQMKFRQLPLLAEDLPYTEVIVLNSNIRPNDKGKDTLSFIIFVDPGRGKESWKIEKAYSDVLMLDTRMRSAVGRSASKRLMSLPEGRLWRDHAPAKVDQRKVRRRSFPCVAIRLLLAWGDVGHLFTVSMHLSSILLLI